VLIEADVLPRESWSTGVEEYTSGDKCLGSIGSANLVRQPFSRARLSVLVADYPMRLGRKALT